MKIACKILIVLLSGGISAGFATASDDLEGVQRIDAEGMIERMGEYGESMVVIDSRIRMDRQHGYIEGSLSLPDEETTCESLADLLPDSDSKAVFYCNGPKCGRSKVAVEIARTCGYSELYWFPGGMEEWRAKGYPVLKL